MKDKKHEVMYWGAVLVMGLLYMFWDDLAWFGRMGKHEELWWWACHDSSGNQQLVCMANNDVTVIYVLLAVLIYLIYKLVPIYQKEVLIIPLWGIIANIVCVITWHSMVYLIHG